MLNYSKCTLRTVGYHYMYIYHCFTHTNSRTISRTWMDFKMADTSKRRVFCNTILLKYHACEGKLVFFIINFKFATAFNLNKCLKQIILPLSELPSKLSAIFLYRKRNTPDRSIAWCLGRSATTGTSDLSYWWPWMCWILSW